MDVLAAPSSPTGTSSLASTLTHPGEVTFTRPSYTMSTNAPSDTSSPTSLPPTLAPLKSASPPPRISIDSTNVASSSTAKWLDSAPPTERRDTFSSIAHSDTATGLENFDDNVLRTLCELDCGVPLLLDRIKQSMVSCREASLFLKKRAALEEEYGRSMQKLARTSSEVYSLNDGKAGTFVAAWQTSMRIHEVIAENRFRFAQRLSDISEELITLCKHVEKSRKETKELASRYERALTDAETSLEKSKARHDNALEELERLLYQKEGESYNKETGFQAGRSPGGKRAIGKAMSKGGLLLKGKNPGNLQRQEEEIRARVSTASTVMAKQIQETQAMRQEYFNLQLPRILRSLKEGADEIDNGLQYHLGRYAFLFESLLQTDGNTLLPPDRDGLGLRSAVEIIDNRQDFRVYMQNYAVAYAQSGAKTLRREGPWQEGFIHQPQPHPSPHPHAAPPGQATTPTNAPHNNLSGSNSQNSLDNLAGHGANVNATANATPPLVDKGTPTFGVDLSEQLTRDKVDVPRIMQKCCEAIEKWGLTAKGIYRVSGTQSRVLKLKERLDKDIDGVDLDSAEWSSDINNVASVLKLWLRELPEPLLTHALHQGFIDAAKIEIERMRHIRLHERVNDLPDANYATLKFFLGHLHRISQNEADNQMGNHNLAVVFGPTLFGISGTVGAGGQNGMGDSTWQNRAIETILDHYEDIFIDEGEP